MDCERAAAIIFLFVDNELEKDQLDPFRQHLDRCPHCKQKARYTHKLLLVVRQRCTRFSAPQRLRRRILISLPHRNDVPLTD